MLKDQDFLRVPGPTPIPPSVQRAMTKPMIGHRSSGFKEIFSNLVPRLKPIFGTEQEVLTIAGSGTSGLEAAVVNVVKPGDEVLVLVTGAFGDRFAKICEQYHIYVHRIDVPWGQAVPLEKVRECMEENHNIRAVFATFCETSTGVLNPIADIAKVIHESSEALFIVDGVSCIGAVKTEMDCWGVDLFITGSQKAMMLPTGLAFLAISERSWKVIELNDQPRFYLDLLKYRKSMNDHSTPFTPAVSLLYGLEQSLNLLEEEGLENVYKRHLLMKEMTRSACRALGLPLLTADGNASPTVTAVKPTLFSSDDLRNFLKKEFSLTLAGGQQSLKGEIFRVGHMGYCSPADVLQTISMLEVGLRASGVDVELGRGTAAAQDVYLKGEK
ncbi:alanine--glyoxylate aminotransferase family protein [Bacillus shivajii]|uniref:pyridoxal-phosphate-dependent aminotransferase family protein n=1 Tax=Bacillus shivajii TaxID=1983719 RepID=UPI001CFAD00B|nr:alanine--glyoxylate aminotransferase family protein [Bacillus shivajii]UCZ55377.1 alanine--glyoxylate aminotransferase family protein [Bacillus shivajii]